MNIWLSLNKALTLYPDHEAIVDGDRRFTYADMGRRVANLVRSLSSLGLGRDDVVAILAPNCHQYMETYYACGISGIVLSPLNFRLAPAELVSILHDSGAQVLFAHADFSQETMEIAQQCPGIKKIIWIGNPGCELLQTHVEDYEKLSTTGSGTMPDLPHLPHDQLAHLYYTSGTTGRPKGVMLTQGNVSFNALAVIAEMGFNHGDCWLHAAPMFHLADAWAVFALTWVGGKHIFTPYFRAPEILPLVEKYKITTTVLVPTMLLALLNDPNVEKFDYKSLRLIITGGSPIAPETVRRVGATFDCEYVQLYGMTETSPFLTVSRPKGDQTGLSETAELEIRSRTGRPYIGAEVKVVRADGSEVANNNLEVGEIVARGPTVFAGYWKQPEATAETIRNGWIHTGDLAVIDEHGSINIVDRQKDMIITGGENVYSTEVEHAIYEHCAIHECAVLGIPDEFWGESVKAVVVLRPGQQLDETDLIEFVKERLAHYKVPRSVDFLPEMPKTGSGKIYKKGLREQYWCEREKQVN